MTEELRHYELSLTLWEELIQLQAFPLLDPFIIRQGDKIGWDQSKQYDSMLPSNIQAVVVE